MLTDEEISDFVEGKTYCKRNKIGCGNFHSLVKRNTANRNSESGEHSCSSA
ncbi:hypothetical protein DPMN_100395 [Dreissena polymorpha]|uniref:Uncharacterized protein n=1 Tax=Dreissena polymorpha TaxID=45954 RepID=A0A9D4LFW0_DREPO|nr:hypothetical protein DPMN_100395 [Dreissena polymorpha]